MRLFQPHLRPGRRARLSVLTLLMILLLAMTAATAPAQEEADGETYPTDAEVAATLEPIVLSETRRGDVTTITLEIPVGADTFTTSGQPNTNLSTNPNLRVGFNTTQGLGAERIFLFFDVSSIPSNATIESARLRVFMNGFSPNGDAPMALLARFLSSQWDASILTWNNFNPAWGAEIGVGDIPATTGWIDANATGPVAEWVSGQRPNFGMMIQGDETPQQRERIFTAINANNGLHPRLVVTYNVNVDTTPPTSNVQQLPQWSPGSFTVRWSGTDNPGGSGIRHFDVQFRVNGGAWQNWQMATTATSAKKTNQNNNIYNFPVPAVDNANNVEQFSNTPDAGTTVDTVPPNATVNPLPQFTFSDTFNVSWMGTDTGSGPNGGSGIAHYDVEFQLDGGPWLPFTSVTTTTSGTVLNALPGQVYGFRARAVDRVGNVQPFPGGAQTQTTISLGDPSANILPFNPPIVKQNTFMVQWTGSAAPGATIVAYDVQFRFNNGPWQTWLLNVGGTSGQFTAAQGDGIYEFEVRARDSIGRLSPFTGGPGNSVAVDVQAPTITVRGFFPITSDN
ncbi:MAG TPA: DNRLRE domain-containing protein [Promineifilum sp.]|nr:DNRLRE domain-containing protein [Promineifilum sp.]